MFGEISNFWGKGVPSDDGEDGEGRSHGAAPEVRPAEGFLDVRRVDGGAEHGGGAGEQHGSGSSRVHALQGQIDVAGGEGLVGREDALRGGHAEHELGGLGGERPRVHAHRPEQHARLLLQRPRRHRRHGQHRAAALSHGLHGAAQDGRLLAR